MQTQTPAVKVQAGGIIPDPTSTTRYPGDVVNFGTIPLVVVPTDPNLPGVNSLDSEGVYDVPKTSDTFTYGDAVYWNSAGDPVVGTAGTGAADNATGNLMGMAVANAASGDTYVRTKLTAAKRTATIAGSVTADDITGSDSSLGITGKAGNNSVGGEVVIAGGADNNNNNGGNTVIRGGANDGTGTYGNVNIGDSNTTAINFGIMPRIPVATVAVGGTAIGNANAVAEGYTRVTGADNTAAVKLPTPVAGAQCILKNSVATALLIVFPAVGTQINAKGNNNAYNMGNAAVRRFVAFNSQVWETDPETIV